MQEKARELDRRLSEYLVAVNAQMPQVNPNYDPSKGEPPQNTGKRGPGDHKSKGPKAHKDKSRKKGD